MNLSRMRNAWVGACLLVAGASLPRVAAAQTNCAQVTSRTTAAPNASAQVYLNLQSDCTRRACGNSFSVSSSTSMQQKCRLLRDAILGSPSCQDAGFAVTADDCDAGAGPQFTVADPNCPTTTRDAGLLLGISNNQLAFTQEGRGLPDYEQEILSQPGPDAGCSPAVSNILWVNGHGTGISMSGGPPQVSVTIVLQDGTTSSRATVSTRSGDTAATVMVLLRNLLNQDPQLISHGVTCSLLGALPDGGIPNGVRPILQCIPTTGVISAGMQIDDTGFNLAGMQGGTRIVQKFGEVALGQADPFLFANTNCTGSTCAQSKEMFPAGCLTSCPPDVAQCGQISDGCNGFINCGVCGAGQICSANQCVTGSGVPGLPNGYVVTLLLGLLAGTGILFLRARRATLTG